MELSSKVHFLEKSRQEVLTGITDGEGRGSMVYYGVEFAE
jgi:hypothetical protein